MELARRVLAHYPAALHGTITPLGNHGGFSGARLFRVDAPGGPLCLRAWPADVAADRLDFIHALMGRAVGAGLDFVPRVRATLTGGSHVLSADRRWELTAWMPGAAADIAQPARLHAACSALAGVHRAWAEPLATRGVCPAIERRWAAYRDWLPLTTSGWQPPNDPLDPVAPVAARAWAQLRRRLPELPHILLPWSARLVPLRPCLCDVRSEHILFTGHRVTGLVDFGSCKLDHVAVDLARLLGGTDPVHWTAGFNAYAQLRPLTADDQALARDLDRSGAIVAVANWLRWLYRDGRTCDDRGAVARRLTRLVGRLE